MNSLPVRLKLTTASRRAVSGWLVRGETAADWLTAVAACADEQESLRFLPLADPEHPARAAAALILSPRLAGLPVPAGCRAYGYAAERLLIPMEAEIEPPLTPDEFRDWMPDADAVFVWHPASGLVRFDPSDVLTIFDLLRGPVEQTADWSAARVAPAFVDRLLSVASAEPMRTMADVEAEWNQEIGPTRPIENLPPAPGEAPLKWKERLALATARFRAAWRRWWNSRRTTTSAFEGPQRSNANVGFFIYLMAAVALIWLCLIGPGQFSPLAILIAVVVSLLIIAALLGLLGGAGASGGGQSSPQTGPVPTTSPRRAGGGMLSQWWNRFRQWRESRSAASKSTGSWMQQADRALRQREIERLLHLLVQNPDDGLRYAIPFGGDAGRGRGVAGNQLVGRDLNFRLAPGGGGPVDAWDIDPQQQMQLLQRYRELAEREQRAGRHRRAAYVYSQLLGDWHSAANALKGGHHYAEAAVIYHERLKNFGEAAKCYELAGQHASALKLYREQNQWVAAGDLCQRLGRETEAEHDYRTGVDKSLTAGDMRTAAEVLEMKLHVVDEALDVLERTWPDHANSDQHFDLWFAVAGRNARHDAARRRIESLAGSTSSVSALKLLPRLQRLQDGYPDAAVQHAAKERTLHVVARHLPESAPPEARQLSMFLPPLSPQDRLLPRDCQRFVDRVRQLGLRAVLPKLTQAAQLRLETRLPQQFDRVIERILACDQGWVMLEEPVGNLPQTLRLVSWSLSTQQVQLDRGPDNRRYALAAVNEHRREIWLHPPGTESPVSWPQRPEAWRITYPYFLPRNWLAVQPLPSGMSHVLWIDDGGLAWLSLFAADGSIARSCRIAEEWYADPAYAIPMVRGAASIISAGEDELFAFLPVNDEEVLGECFDAQGVRIWIDGIRGRHVIGPVVPGSAQMLIPADDHVSLLEDPRLSEAGHRVLAGWAQPRTAVLPGGLFAVADDRRVAVFTASEGRQILECAHTSSRPRAISPAGIGRLSILREQGEIEIWSW